MDAGPADTRWQRGTWAAGARSGAGLLCGCGGRLRAEGEAVRCVDCRSRRPIGIGGVVGLAESDVPWSGIPTDVLEQIRAATTADEIIDAMLDPARPWPQPLQVRLLHPGGAAAVALALPEAGMEVLDLGTGWPTLARAVRSLGARTTSADPVELRLRFEQLMHAQPSAEAVHLSSSAPLPWRSASFDRVFLDLPELRRSGADLDTTLAEVRRVLTDDGALVLAHDHGRDPNARRLRRSLVAHGLTPAHEVAAFPRRNDWRWLAPPHAPPDRPSGESTRRAARLVSRQTAERALRALGGARWIARDRYVVAHPGGARTGPTPLAELVGGTGSQVPAIMRLSDARVAVLGADSFVKLPLSEQQQSAVVQEARNTRTARTTAFAPFVIDADHVGDRAGFPYVRYPRLRERRARPGEAVAVVQAALDAVAPGESAPLRDTVFWERLSSPRAQHDAAETGASGLRAWILETWGDVVVSVGPTHGDLHPGNVVLARQGRPLLVDWNRFELRNPLLLDAGYAAIEHHRRVVGTSFADALAAYRDARLEGPLVRHAELMRGTLTSDAAAAVILLDRLVSYSLPRRRHKPWTMGAMTRAVDALRVPDHGDRVSDGPQ